MSWVVTAASAVGFGFVSAWVPVANAEAYVGTAGAKFGTTTLVIVIIALAVGQTLGKLLIFESARRGASWWGNRRAQRETTKSIKWVERLTEALRSNRTGAPMVLASSALGVPPLAVTSVVAGAVGQNRWLFTVLCLVGRLARFAAVGAGVAVWFH